MIGPVVLVLRLLMLVALYGFLGLALLTLWREFQSSGENLSRRRIPGINLEYKSVDGQLQLLHFSQPEITIGRSPDCDFILNDETISVRHGLLTYHHAQWWLEDLKSTNGTKLNRLPVTMPTVVTTGDVVELGNVQVTINLPVEVVSSPTRKMEENE